MAKKSRCCFQNIEDRKGGNKYRRGEIWQKKKQVLLPKRSNRCHTDFARSHMNNICLISSEPDRQIGQSEVVDSSRRRKVVEVAKKATAA